MSAEGYGAPTDHNGILDDDDLDDLDDEDDEDDETMRMTRTTKISTTMTTLIEITGWDRATVPIP